MESLQSAMAISTMEAQKALRFIVLLANEEGKGLGKAMCLWKQAAFQRLLTHKAKRNQALARKEKPTLAGRTDVAVGRGGHYRPLQPQTTLSLPLL